MINNGILIGNLGTKIFASNAAVKRSAICYSFDI